MRRIKSVIILSAILFVASGCGPGGGYSSEPAYGVTKGTTGYTNSAGVPYVTPDERMTKELENPTPAPVMPDPTPVKPGGKTGKTDIAPVPPPQKTLVERLKEYEIGRFMEPNGGAPWVFGNKRFEITVFFSDVKDGIVFVQPVQPGSSFTFNQTKGGYSLQGTFIDYTSENRTDGDLWLTDLTHHETAHILYRAYKADIKVHADRDRPPAAGSAIKTKLDELQQKSYGWVYNWSVVRGKAFYLVDLVEPVNPGSSSNSRSGSSPGTVAPTDPVKTVFSIKGESLRTGDQDHPADSLTPDFAKDVQLVGNGEKSGLRIFSAQMEDKQSAEKYDFTIDLEQEKRKVAFADNSPTPQVGTGSTAHPDVATAAAPDEDTIGDDVDPSLGPIAPAEQAQEDAPTSPVVAAPSGHSGSVSPPARTGTGSKNSAPTAANVPHANSTAAATGANTAAPPATPPKRTVIIGTSFLRFNLHLPHTAKMVRDFSRNRYLDGVTSYIRQYRKGPELSNFYFYAFPLRNLLQAIAEHFDVPPIYAYLTVKESSYLTSGKFNNKQIGDGGRAFGPFQMHVEAADESSVRHTGRADDERFFFVPSACGAAKYLQKQVPKFIGNDSTFAILGYNQGPTGAERWARKYGYTYAKMSRASAKVTTAQREYVERVLAIYFISSDMPSFGYEPNRYVNSTPPPRRTLMPTTPIHSAECAAIVSQAQLP